MAASNKKSKADTLSPEELLLETAWCNALTRITDEFLHDIRSKLTGLYTGVQLSPTELLGASAEMFGLMRESATEVNELLRIIMQLRNPARKSGLYNLGPLSNESVVILKTVLGCERVHLDLKNESLPIKGNPDRIQRAILLLALRFADCLPEHAKLTLRASEINELPPVTNPHPNFLKPPCVCVSISSDTTAPTRQHGDNQTSRDVLLARHIIDQAHGLLAIEPFPIIILPRQKL